MDVAMSEPAQLAETADAVAEILTALAVEPDMGGLSDQFQWWSDLVDGSDEDEDEDDDDDDDDDDEDHNDHNDHNDHEEDCEEPSHGQPEAPPSDLSRQQQGTAPSGATALTSSSLSSSTTNTSDTSTTSTAAATMTAAPPTIVVDDATGASSTKGILKAETAAPATSTAAPSAKDQLQTIQYPTSGSNFSRWRRRAMSRRAKNFQSSLRLSIRKRSQRKRAPGSQQPDENTEPNKENYVDGIAEVLTVLAERGKEGDAGNGDAPLPETKEQEEEEEEEEEEGEVVEGSPLQRGRSGNSLAKPAHLAAKNKTTSNSSDGDGKDDSTPSFARHVRESMRRRMSSFSRHSPIRDSRSPTMRRRAVAARSKYKSPSARSSGGTRRGDAVPTSASVEGRVGGDHGHPGDGDDDGKGDWKQRSRSSAVVSIRRKDEDQQDRRTALSATASAMNVTQGSSGDVSSHGTHQEAVMLKRAVRGLSRSRLSASVRRGHISHKSAKLSAKFVADELEKLVAAIKRIGRLDKPTGQYNVTFGVLFEKTEDVFAASDVDGILLTARSVGLITYLGGLLFPGRDDLVLITLVSDQVPQDENAYTLGQIRNVSMRRSRRRSTKGKREDTTGGGGGGGGGGAIPFGEQRLGASVRRGELSANSATAAIKWVDTQIRLLVEAIIKYGLRNDDGNLQINFGVLYDKTVNTLEAAEVGALLDSARAKGVVSFVGDNLKVFDDDLTTITLLTEHVTDSTQDTYTFGEIRRLSLRQRRPSRRSRRSQRRD
ncbi:hypothetical protein PTSG_03691 [Salpingoeca rosetta]|uniref:Costars domain-containing protein n=1 Tax=Salpingoeca rosetta (strain ATCC 50818 / BSB-021) TaxID=946362 RepID=F2U6B2_SALR5|nr:uncharacterized protein PTSG_03691 [Salpingoeca rosetta]EGD83053.1 hypothetical protein PTSG_03691 [Salpingoeca rosetta]|eukprot:XP_004995417.1 hypothetical protein PTSG_03691 [Salpingoeca rosetta]